MAKSSADLWYERILNQRLPLIGSINPGEGNGFHDRISFDVPYHALPRDNTRLNNSLYTVYFRDLSLLFDSLCKSDENSLQEKDILVNCTENFFNTFIKYSDSSSDWEPKGIFEIIKKWGKELIFNGRVIIEFVSWKDNDSNEFYAYELKYVDAKYVSYKSKNIIYTAPCFNNKDIIINSVKIPKSKCILITWPYELGGYNFYQKTVNNILSIEDEFDIYKGGGYNIHDPALMINRMKKKDRDFAHYVKNWGYTQLTDDLSDYYMQNNNFRLRKTILLCFQEVFRGLEQLISILNEELNEQANLNLKTDRYNLKIFEEMENKWLKGKLSFKESSTYLRP